MSTLRRVSLFSPLLLFCSFAFSFDFPPIAPEEMALTGVPEQPGAPAIVLDREEEDNDKLHAHSVYQRIKIFTEPGRAYADVQLPYNRRHFNIDSISGRTVHADGSIVPFQGKPFDKVVEKGHGVRVHVKSFTLPDVQVGSIIEYRYSVRYADNVVTFPEWTVQEDLFQKRAKFRFVPIRRDFSLDRGHVEGIAWTTFLPKDYKVEEKITPVSYAVELDAPNVPAFRREPHMFPEQTMKYRVNFYYRLGEMKNFWKDEGKYWNKHVEAFLGHKKGVAEAASKIVTPSDTPEQKVRKIYAFVSQLENRSFIPLRADAEQRILGLRPNEGVDDVLAQNSGTHDELNSLFVAMVRATGIDAWVMEVPSRDRTFFQEAFLSSEQFDAEVAIVSLNGKDVFLDPGTRYCPYGLMDWRYSSSKGIRQTAKGTEFADTPGTTYSDAVVIRIARLKLTDHGTVEGTVAVGFNGLEALNRRQSLGKTDDEGRKKELEDEVKSWLPGSSEVTLTRIGNWDVADKQLSAEFKVTSPLATSAGKRWIITPLLFHVNEKPMFSAAERVNPIYLYYQSREIDEIHIALPPEAEIESLPPNTQVKLEYAMYQNEQKPEGHGIFGRRDLAMGTIGIAVEEYKDIKGFYDKVKAADDQQAILRGAPHAAGN